MITLSNENTNRSLFQNYSLEVTGKDIGQIESAKSGIPPGTPINIAFLGNESHEQRINAARVIREAGLDPVPIISSRRLKSLQDRDALLSGLIDAAHPTRFIFVGGDPASPAGPFQDSLDLIASNIVSDYEIRNVGIVGYPEGHPKIERERLWDALSRKIDLLSGSGCTVEITTQFGFDADAMVDWIDRVRAVDISVPIRIGVPGPAYVKRLLRFAAQFGVDSSAAIIRKYGFSLANLVSKAGPERFLAQLMKGIAERDMRTILLHLYPFGGIAETVRWADQHV